MRIKYPKHPSGCLNQLNIFIMDEYRKQDLWILFKENKEVTITFVSEYYDWTVDKTIQTQEDLTYFNFDEAVNDIEIRSNSEQIYF